QGTAKPPRRSGDIPVAVLHSAKRQLCLRACLQTSAQSDQALRALEERRQKCRRSLRVISARRLHSRGSTLNLPATPREFTARSYMLSAYEGGMLNAPAQVGRTEYSNVFVSSSARSQKISARSSRTSTYSAPASVPRPGFSAFSSPCGAKSN